MIEKTHHAQNQVNLDILNFVVARVSVSFSELFAAFGDASRTDYDATRAFGKKLEYLVFTDRLLSSGRGNSRTFTVGPLAGKPQPSAAKAGHTTAPVDSWPDSYTPQRVPARQFDAMHGPVYVSGPVPVLRPGSLDFKRVASRGDRC